MESKLMNSNINNGNEVKITLRPVDKENWRHVAHLKVSGSQREYVMEPSYYLAICNYEYIWNPLAIYLDKQVIGFMMWGIDPEDGYCWFGGIMVDQSVQNRGYGGQAILAAIKMLNEKHGYKNFALSYQPDNIIAKQLYSKLGFVETNETVDDEVVARLTIEE